MLIECLENLCDDYLYRANEKAKIAVTRCIEILQGTPTADVAEVKHGEWIEIDYGNTFICDQCNVRFKNNLNYCPNCGAKMNGGNLS